MEQNSMKLTYTLKDMINLKAITGWGQNPEFQNLDGALCHSVAQIFEVFF